MPCLIAFSTSVMSIIGGSSRARPRRHVDLELEALPDAKLLDVEVGVRERDLLLERRRRGAHSRQRRAQVVEESLEHAPARLRLAAIQPLHVARAC
jgi:hypothetical protein